MNTPARNVDLQERSSVLSKKAHRAFKNMPILSEISRRFHMLTTDAKPDPPRIEIAGYTHDLSSDENSKTQSKSASTIPNKEQIHNDIISIQRKKSVPNEATPTTESCTKPENLDDTRCPPMNESKDYKKPGVRTKAKPKHNKYSQATNIVNYNIVNSNGVKIGSKTSYICNINPCAANNNASSQSETSCSKPKHRAMPEHVEELSTCEEELALEDMIIIKTHLGYGWRDVARRLSYSNGQIQQFEENYRHIGTNEIIYQLLLDWKQSQTKDAQLGTLVSILWSCQEYDCVERLVVTRKTRSC